MLDSSSLHLLQSHTVSLFWVFLTVRYFRNEESAENVIVKKVGNVTADSEFTYEYGVRRKSTREKGSDPDSAKSESEKIIDCRT